MSQVAGQTEAVEHPDDLRRLVADAVTADSAEARWSAVAAVPPSLVRLNFHFEMSQTTSSRGFSFSMASSVFG